VWLPAVVVRFALRVQGVVVLTPILSALAFLNLKIAVTEKVSVDGKLMANVAGPRLLTLNNVYKLLKIRYLRHLLPKYY
jgi:hypothetical protein